jgi:hypothetical protein
MPVIVGSPRSGTTLLRLMLDAHPQLAIPPETGFLACGAGLTNGPGTAPDNFCSNITGYPDGAPNWPDFGLSADALRAQLVRLDPFDVGDALRVFYRAYAARFQKRRWGEKTPLYCHHLTTIQTLLPEARFIHLVRDGRDAAISLRERWFSPGRDIATQARYWRENVLAARHQGIVCRHYLELHFEALIAETEIQLRRICDFIELDFDPRMLQYHRHAAARLVEHGERRRRDGSLVVSGPERARQQLRASQPADPAAIGVWRSALTQGEAATFTTIAGDALALFGYSD